MDEGRYEEAIAEFDSALFSDGSMAATFPNRALAEQRTDSLSSAIQDYTRSIELNPELALAYQNRTSTCLETVDCQNTGWPTSNNHWNWETDLRRFRPSWAWAF